MRVGFVRVKVLSPRQLFGRTPTRTYATMSASAKFHLRNKSQLVIQKGDITQWQGDAVVNAANERMLGGGGVDGAIHRASGPHLLEACRRYPAIINERCPTGDARITLAYDMPCKWIIHTVGPIYNKGSPRASQDELASAYLASLAVANGVGAETVAFPAISCGIYGYPLQAACQVALRACWDGSGDLQEVHFVLFGNDTYDIWLAEAQKRLKPVADSSQAAGDSPANNVAETSQKPSATPSNAVASGAFMEAPKESASQSDQTGDDSAVQTLTGVKQGQAADAANEALAAPKVLEAAEPVKETDLPGHSTNKQNQAADVSSPDADVGMVDADTDVKSSQQRNN